MTPIHHFSSLISNFSTIPQTLRNGSHRRLPAELDAIFPEFHGIYCDDKEPHPISNAAVSQSKSVSHEVAPRATGHPCPDTLNILSFMFHDGTKDVPHARFHKAEWLKSCNASFLIRRSFSLSFSSYP